MKYEFHVGDYVETKNDARGYVDNVNEMIWKCAQSSNDYTYVAGHTYCIPVKGFDNYFNRIGQYDFTKKDTGKIEHLDYTERFIRNSPAETTLISYMKKINELVDAVNALGDKRDEHESD